MNRQDFFDKCVPDAKCFFNIYFAFMAVINNLPKGISSVIEKGKDKYLDGREKQVFYFLYLLCNTRTDIGVMLKQHGVDIDTYYDILPGIKLKFLEEILEKNDSYDDNKKDAFFHDFFRKEDSLTGIFDNLDKITIEGAFSNLVTKYMQHYDDLLSNFKIHEVLDQIQGLAIAKSSGGKTFINIKRNLNSESLKGLLKDAGSDESNESSLFIGEELTKKEFGDNPLIGRDKELRLMGAYLLDENKSLILHGEPGVGKTALVEGLAYHIQNNTSHPLLNNKRLFGVSAAEIVEGTKYRGELEKRMLNLMRELMNMKNAILFIDEIHMIMGGGKLLGDTIDIANMLKPYIGNGKVKIIGATTDEELKLITSNGALARRFNTLMIPELSSIQVKNILNNLISNMETRKQISFGFSEENKKEILDIILSLTNNKYLGESKLFNPDFALTILRNSYNLANYDGKDKLDIDTLIESIQISEAISEEGKQWFQEEIYKRVKVKNI